MLPPWLTQEARTQHHRVQRRWTASNLPQMPLPAAPAGGLLARQGCPGLWRPFAHRKPKLFKQQKVFKRVKGSTTGTGPSSSVLCFQAMGGPAWLLKLLGEPAAGWGKAGAGPHQLLGLLLSQHGAAGARGQPGCTGLLCAGHGAGCHVHCGNQPLTRNQNLLSHVSVPLLCGLPPGPQKWTSHLDNPSGINGLLSPRARSKELVVPARKNAACVPDAAACAPSGGSVTH